MGGRGRRGGRPQPKKVKDFGLPAPPGVDRAGRLRVTRLKIGGANSVGRVLRLVRALLEIGGVAGPEPHQNGGAKEAAKRNA